MGQIFVAILLILEVLCSFLLISVILLQKSKGGGLGGTAFGGGGGDSLFGARTGTVLTKITITLSIFFLANTLVLAFVYAGPRERSLMDSRRPVDIVPVEPAPADLPATAVPMPSPVVLEEDAFSFEMPSDPAMLQGEPMEAEALPDGDAGQAEPAPINVDAEAAISMEAETAAALDELLEASSLEPVLAEPEME